MSLSPEERDRYRRHLLLPEIGGQGQQRLKDATVLVVGAGGIGCPLLSYLVAAGTGTVRFCDPDTVDQSNLQRQVLYSQDDIGRPKVVAAAERLSRINTHVTLDPQGMAFTEETSAALMAGCDVVIEGVDRFAPRFTINEACQASSVPLISAALGRFDGQVGVFPGTPGTACYQCLVPSPPDDAVVCETEGVLGAVPGIVGSAAAMSALLFISGALPMPDTSTLDVFHGLSGTMRRVSVPKDPACPVCAND